MSKHTPEPWHIGTGAQQNAAMIRRDAKRGQAIAQVFYANQAPIELDGCGTANAARIVACINALAGIPDPAAFVKAARAMSFVVSCQSDDCTDESPCEACKRHSAFRAADKPA